MVSAIGDRQLHECDEDKLIGKLQMIEGKYDKDNGEQCCHYV